MLEFNKGDQLPGGHRMYRKMTVVPMVKMDEPFTCQSREGYLNGEAGDFLVEDGHGGFYPVSAEFHQLNYREADDVS